MAQVTYLEGIVPNCCKYDYCTKGQAAYCWWKIKTWKILNSSGSVGDHKPPAGTVCVPWITISNEKQLVCPFFNTYGGTWQYLAYTDPITGEQYFYDDNCYITIGSDNGQFFVNFYTGVAEIGGSLGATSGGDNEAGSVAGTCTVSLGGGLGTFNFALFNRSAGSTNTLNVTIGENTVWNFN